MLQNITKSPLQKGLLIVGLLLSIILQYPQPKLDLPYYKFLASNYTANEDEQRPLKGLHIVITGATSGLGLDLSKQLFQLGATIIAVGRSQSKLSTLANHLLPNQDEGQQDEEKRIVLVQSDLQDMNSVSDAANQIKAKFKTIDFLVNNAGMTHVSDGTVQQTPQGYDMVFAVNYLSHFLLTEKLLPNLRRSKVRNGPRIIQVASSMHLMVNGDDLVPTGGSSSSSDSSPLASQPSDSALHNMRSYGNSKLAQIYHARALSRELSSTYPQKESKLKIVSVCPSWVATYIAGTQMKSLLDIFAFRSDGYGLASILFAMFHGDVGDSHLKNGRYKDYVTNCGILDSQILSVIDRLVTWIPIPYCREVLTWAGGIGLLFFQKMNASVNFRPTSREGYDMEKQDALYLWSKEAVKPWV